MSQSLFASHFLFLYRFLYRTFGNFAFIFGLAFLANLLALPAVLAQESTTNGLSLRISYVDTDGKRLENTEVRRNVWEFQDGELGPEDLIRYSWTGPTLDVKYKDAPSDNAGYLKIYLNDDSSEENLITNYGSSPLPINILKDRLVNGENRLLFVHIDKTGQAAKPETKVAFVFRYLNASVKPSLSLLEPAEGNTLMKDVDRNFKLELENFSLESNNSKNTNKGQLKVFFNEVREENRLLTVKSSKEVSPNKHLVEFSSKDFDTAKAIPDSRDTKLIFQLFSSTDQPLEGKVERRFISNYGQTINIGTPKIQILEPRKDRTDLTVNGDQRFVLSVENFEILKEISSGGNEDNKGYLQIFVDDQPRKRIHPEQSFSLNEIGFTDKVEGRKTVRVQLVNKDFTKLKPEASDEIAIVYVPNTVAEATQTQVAGTSPIENSSWRIIVVSLIVILVVGGIVVLITKG